MFLVKLVKPPARVKINLIKKRVFFALQTEFCLQAHPAFPFYRRNIYMGIVQLWYGLEGFVVLRDFRRKSSRRTDKTIMSLSRFCSFFRNMDASTSCFRMGRKMIPLFVQYSCRYFYRFFAENRVRFRRGTRHFRPSFLVISEKICVEKLVFLGAMQTSNYKWNYL